MEIIDLMSVVRMKALFRSLWVTHLPSSPPFALIDKPVPDQLHGMVHSNHFLFSFDLQWNKMVTAVQQKLTLMTVNTMVIIIIPCDESYTE